MSQRWNPVQIMGENENDLPARLLLKASARPLRPETPIPDVRIR